MRKTYKNFISLCAVLISALVMITVNAFADPMAGAVTAGMGAMGVAVSGTGSAQAYGDYVTGQTSSDPLGDWTDPLGDYQVYYKKNAKQVEESGQLIDYDEVWFSPDFASRIQNSGISFIQDKSIVSNYSGTLVSGAGYVDGLGIYSDGGTYKYSQNFSYPAIAGSYPFSDNIYIDIAAVSTTGSSAIAKKYDSQNQTTISGGTLNSNFPLLVRYRVNSSGTAVAQIKFDSSANWTTMQAWPQSPTFVNDPFTFSYVSGTIDMTPVEDEGLVVYIPHDLVPAEYQDGYYVSTQSTDAPVILGIADGITAASIEGKLDSPEWTSDVPPVPPPPTPVPTTPLGELGTDEFYDLIGLPILEGQEEIIQDINDFNDDVSEGLNDIGEQLDDTNDTLESIDTNIGIGNGILNGIKTLAQTISTTLSDILQGVQDLVQEIVLSTETFIAGLLNTIIGSFGGWLQTMRNAFSIWHYVVEWVGSISSVFSWFWSMAGSTSYYIQLPIYASLAGAVVLAFYKRFGR